jgi:hypothetical protein
MSRPASAFAGLPGYALIKLIDGWTRQILARVNSARSAKFSSHLNSSKPVLPDFLQHCKDKEDKAKRQKEHQL